MKDFSDEQLVSLTKQNQEEALNILISRYLKSIYNFVLRYVNNQSDAEDVTQEIFIKMWRNLKKFKQEKKIKTWLFAIAKNTAFDFLRKKKIITFSELLKDDKTEKTAVEQIVDAELLPSEIFERQEISLLINRMLDNLPVKQRTVIWLHFQEDLTFQEIAEILKEPLNTIKSHFRRGLINLKENLNKNL